MNIPDWLKNVLSLVQSLLPLLEKKIEVLPVNPAIRKEVSVVSVILAAVLGFGTFRLIKANQGYRWLAWVWLVATIGCLALILAVGNGSISGLSPDAAALLMRFSYVLFFAFLGGAIGGFLGW